MRVAVMGPHEATLPALYLGAAPPSILMTFP